MSVLLQLDAPKSSLVCITACCFHYTAIGVNVAGTMTVNGATLAPTPLTGGGASPIIVQVPQVSAVHALSMTAPPLGGSAATAVAAAVAQQELHKQQNTQQVSTHVIQSHNMSNFNHQHQCVPSQEYILFHQAPCVVLQASWPEL